MNGAQCLIAWAILAWLIIYLWPRTNGFKNFDVTQAFGCGFLIFLVSFFMGALFVWISRK
jgi:hypothetical protein